MKREKAMRTIATGRILDEYGRFPSFGLKPGELVKVTEGEKFWSPPIKSVVIQETGRCVILRHYFKGPWGYAYDHTGSVSKAGLYAGEEELIRVKTGEALGRCQHEAV